MQHEKKVSFITGARSGVGLELTKRLLSEGWDVITVLRTPFKADPAIVKAISDGRLRTYNADLANFADLRSVVTMIVSQEPSIDLLFNNAGVNPEALEFSPQGREMCFEVNTVVPYILSRALLPVLARSPQGKIVNTSSNMLLGVKRFHTATLKHPPHFKKLFGSYAHSKLALSLWTKAVADEFSVEGVSIASVCPGPSKTPMTAGSGMPWPLKIVAKFVFNPPSVGAARLYDVGLGEGLIPNGKFVMKGKSRDIPFSADAQAVLDDVDAIFRKDFLSR